MIKSDKYYIDNLIKINEQGCWDENPRPKWSDDKSAHSKFITQVFETYDISKGEFPITTLRNTATKTGIKEIFWIYQNQSNKLEDAHNLGIKWWDSWNVGDESIGTVYGYTVNKYNLIDNLLNTLKNDPFGRRHIINLYQYSDLNDNPGLYPCAYETVWSVRKLNNDFYLDMTLIQRSNDYIVAGYINKIQYVALMMMVAGHLKYKVGNFSHLVQNLHIYDRHFDAVEEILNNKPINIQPTLTLKENKNFYDYTINDFEVLNIDNIPKLSNKLEVAV